MLECLSLWLFLFNFSLHKQLMFYHKIEWVEKGEISVNITVVAGLFSFFLSSWWYGSYEEYLIDISFCSVHTDTLFG